MDAVEFLNQLYRRYKSDPERYSETINLNNMEPFSLVTAVYYIGGGDWNLCCSIPHPTPKEKELGFNFTFGHFCYEGSKACDMFKEKE